MPETCGSVILVFIEYPYYEHPYLKFNDMSNLQGSSLNTEQPKLESGKMPFQIASLLEKMSSTDKDYRFMATNDLIVELQNDSIKLDDESERRVVNMVIRLLEDKNGEVQNLAVKCLGPLVHKVKDTQTQAIFSHLCETMINGDEKLRDVSSIALKTAVAELPAATSPLTMAVIKLLVPPLKDALSDTERVDISVKLEIIDIISDILLRYGSLFSPYLKGLQEALLQQLSSDRQALRKRSIMALSNLLALSDVNLYGETMDVIVQHLTAPGASATQFRTMVQTCQSICKTTSRRFVKHLSRLVPVLVDYTVATEDDELRESCIQAFETFVYRCPREITPFISHIVKVAVDYLKHDPNYTYDDDEEMDNISQMDTDGDSDDDDEEGNEYSDDDDMSWKVRRACAKCIEALILSRRDEIVKYLTLFGPLLISRFKEREDNVKWDIMHAYTALLSQIRNLIPNFSAICVPEENGDVKKNACGDVETVTVKGGVLLRNTLSMEQLETLQALDSQIPLLVKAISRLLSTKTLKTKQYCFVLLTHLLRAYPGALGDEMLHLTAGVSSAMNDRSLNTNVKIDTLTFLSGALCTHTPEKLHAYMDVLVPLIVRAVSEQFYKVSAEALTVTTSLIRVLRPVASEQGNFDYSPYVDSIYEAIIGKLKATDIDQEVKEKAITAAGLLVATFGDFLKDKLLTCLPIFLDRLRNEMTRLVTVKALTVIVNSPLSISLHSILSDILLLLAEYLRKNHRTLKISTLNLLDSLVTNYKYGGLDGDEVMRVLQETPALISELDLQISQLTLNFLSHLVVAEPAIISSSLSEILAAYVNLLQSSLLQGATLTASLNFVLALVQAEIPLKPSFEELLDQLTAPAYDNTSLHRQAYRSISACTAVVASASGEQNRCRNLAKKLSEQILSNDTADGVRLFSLLAIGELGCTCPRTFDKFSPKPEELLVNAFNTTSEEMKTAASYALGRLALGNLEKYLPFLLEQINSQPKRQYLLLHALKEVIGSESGDSRAVEIFRPRIEQIWPVLITHATAAEEGTRNVVAECLGKLCLVHPEQLLQRLKKCVTSPNPFMRATAVTAVKFLIVEQWTAIDDLLQSSMTHFLKTVTDDDLNVRRVALIAFNSAAHNKPRLIRDLLPIFLPSLYSETVVKKDLVREVEMGPFKHTVDDGLDLRKAAFECMYTLLETCLERLDIFEFITHVENGLKDQHDIKLLTYLMLARLATLCPSQVLQRLDSLCEPLKTQIQARAKANAVKQENDKQDELRRAALRVVVALQRIPEADRQQQFADLLAIIRSSSEINTIYQLVERDAVHRLYTSDSVMEIE
uniref:TIP120 domain-containing protein n=1 Tax=Elaeophora elaphi TaxID=1147741 RepID=A0A0R3RXJ3_9BILA